MAANPTVDDLRRLRRLADELTANTYTDDDLLAYLRRYALPDAEGRQPTDVDWSGSWDMNCAAADVWEEKAAALAKDFDFAADGGDFKRSQAYAQAMQTANRLRSKRSTKSLRMIATPKPAAAVRLDDWRGNQPESEIE